MGTPNWTGAWVISGTYNLNDLVSYQGSTWISLIGSNVGNQPGQSPSEWAIFAAAGVNGINTWRGAWDSALTYNAFDAVSYLGSSYVSLINSNTANIPALSPSQWGVLAAAGSTGPQGTFVFRGVWSVSLTYFQNNCVTYNGSSYICITDAPSGTLPTNALYWMLMASVGDPGPAGNPGVQGAPGAPIRWRGIWSSTTSYQILDAVGYNGTSFISLTTNTGVNPSTDNGTNWNILAQGTATGPITVGQIQATGVPSASTFLRGDGAWVSVSGGVSSVFARTGAVVAQSGDYASFYAPLTSPNFTGVATFTGSGSQTALIVNCAPGFPAIFNGNGGDAILCNGEFHLAANNSLWLDSGTHLLVQGDMTVSQILNAASSDININTVANALNINNNFGFLTFSGNPAGPRLQLQTENAGVVIDASGNMSVLVNDPGSTLSLTAPQNHVILTNSPATSDNSNAVATTSFVKAQVQAMVQTIQVPISSTQILSLFASPVIIIPAPGSGKFIQIVGGSIEYKHVTTPYTPTGPSNVVGIFIESIPYTLGGMLGGANVMGFMDQSVDMLANWLAFAGNSGQTSNLVVASAVNNKAVVLNCDSSPTGGDGTLLVNVQYVILPL